MGILVDGGTILRMRDLEVAAGLPGGGKRVLNTLSCNSSRRNVLWATGHKDLELKLSSAYKLKL